MQFLGHLALVASLVVLVLLPHILAVDFSGSHNEQSDEEYDYR